MRVTSLVDLVFHKDFIEWKIKMRQKGLDPEHIKNESAKWGTIVHKSIEEYFTKNEPINAHYNITISAAILCGISAIDEIGLKPYSWEDHLYKYDEDGQYVYDGHSDILGLIKGEPWLVDIKTYGLFDDHKDEKKFFKINPDQKKKTNLQTWMYTQCKWKGKDISKAKRGCLHINQYGWEFVEFKRKPNKETLNQLNYFITQTTW